MKLKKELYEFVYDAENNQVATKMVDKVTAARMFDEMNYLQAYCDVMVLYLEIKDSITDLNNYLKTITFNNSYKEFAKANRLTMNMLSSFYSFVQYCEKNVKNFKDQYSHTYYDNNFSYRLFSSLRAYMTHKSLGITRFTYTFNNNDYKTEANIDIERLRDYEKTNKKFSEELHQIKSNKISLNVYVNEFDSVIDNIIIDIFEKKKDEIFTVFKELKKDIPISKSDVVTCFIKDDNGRAHGLFKCLTNFCEMFTKIIIYGNKIYEQPEISLVCYKLLMDISFVYFGKAGIIVAP